ncbi:prealbumin-like fold domain-containing protein [Lactococcus garvieae]
MKTKKQKLKSYLLAGTVLLTVGGTGAVLAQSNGVKLFNAPLRSLPPLPDGGTVNYSFSGTGSAVWSNGETTSANFMKVNDQTTFCLEPFTEVFEGANATKVGQDSAAQKQWNAMTQYQRDLINNITYIGLVNNADGDPNINLATQFALWLIEAGQNEVSGLLPKVSEVDTSKLNNVTDGKTITGLESSGADIHQVIGNATTILKQAVASSQSPEFNPNPLTVIAGSSATSTDKNGVLAGKAGGYGLPFDHIQASEGLSAKRVDNSLEVSATPSAIGTDGVIKVRNSNNIDFQPQYIYGTINPDSTVGQTLFATTDPALLKGQLAVKTIGLGQASLFKLDADTKTPEAQGAAHLENSEWGLFYADGKPVQWTDGQKDYPITKTAGEKVNDKSVVLKMTDLTQGVGVKNLDYSKDTYWQETKAPEGYELSTKNILFTLMKRISLIKTLKTLWKKPQPLTVSAPSALCLIRHKMSMDLSQA